MEIFFMDMSCILFSYVPPLWMSYSCFPENSVFVNVFHPGIVCIFFSSLMMPKLSLGTPALKDGPVHGETHLLGQEATQELPILGLTPGRHLLLPTPG